GDGAQLGVVLEGPERLGGQRVGGDEVDGAGAQGGAQGLLVGEVVQLDAGDGRGRQREVRVAGGDDARLRDRLDAVGPGARARAVAEVVAQGLGVLRVDLRAQVRRGPQGRGAD